MIREKRVSGLSGGAVLVAAVILVGLGIWALSTDQVVVGVGALAVGCWRSWGCSW